MEFFSLISGIDSLRKFAVILGTILIGFGTLFPLQKKLELQDKKINLEKSRQLDSTAIKNLEAEVNKSEQIISINNSKLKKIKTYKDSLLKKSLSEEVKFKINLINEDIKGVEQKNEAIVKDLKDKLFQIQTSKISTESLQKEICNLDSFIKWYHGFQAIFVLLGGVLFYFGIKKWHQSQKESDNLKDIEIKIKQQELIKITKENL